MVKHGVQTQVWVISGFRRDVDEIFALTGHYEAGSGNSLQFLIDVSGQLNGKELPLLAL
jgi:hypothetical protein